MDQSGGERNARERKTSPVLIDRQGRGKRPSIHLIITATVAARPIFRRDLRQVDIHAGYS
jgi:hypothetical protein